MSSPELHQEGNKPGKSQWPWAGCHCQLLEWSNSGHHHLHHHCPLGVCWHLLPHRLHLHLLQAQGDLSFTRNKQQEKWTTACSPSPHSKAMLPSFKQFYLLAIPLLSHTSILLWLRNSSRWCSAVPPVSTLCLLELLKVLCDPGVGFVCSECLAISWKTQQISAFPPSLRGWDPQPWLLGATSLSVKAGSSSRDSDTCCLLMPLLEWKAWELHCASWDAQHSYKHTLWQL